MVKNEKLNNIQKEEVRFINAVSNASLKKDISKEHYLIDEGGLFRYESFFVDPKQPIKDLKYENGDTVKIVCVAGKALIEELHIKALNDDLSMPWLRRAIKNIIEHGKKVAENVYSTI